MPDPSISTLTELVLSIESAWSDLEPFLAGLTEDHVSIQDTNGWTVKDHVTHMAVWEDSVAILFRGKPRHEALGIAQSFYSRASFDQINEVIRQAQGRLTLGEAIDHLHRVHHTLMDSVRVLSDAELNSPVRNFFPQAPQTDERRVADFIHENTTDHFVEHLRRMRALLGRAA